MMTTMTNEALKEKIQKLKDYLEKYQDTIRTEDYDIAANILNELEQYLAPITRTSDPNDLISKYYKFPK